MANPVISSATLNGTSFKPGDKVILTVAYSDPDTHTVTVTVKVDDSEGVTPAATKTLTFVVDPLVVTVTDSDGNVWTKDSDNGSVAVFSTVA